MYAQAPADGEACHVKFQPAHLGIKTFEAFVKELGRNRASHDRKLSFDCADASGCDAT